MCRNATTGPSWGHPPAPSRIPRGHSPSDGAVWACHVWGVAVSDYTRELVACTAAREKKTALSGAGLALGLVHHQTSGTCLAEQQSVMLLTDAHC